MSKPEPPRPIPADRGTYLLVLHLPAAVPGVAIGRLGCFDFEAGFYLYVGSAFGAGGLAARLRHHQRRDKPHPHWHIDYLRAQAHLCEIWSVSYPQPLEESWCQTLLHQQWLQQPIPRFGASDTRNATHLFYTPRKPSPALLSRLLLRPLYALASDAPWAATIDLLADEG